MELNDDQLKNFFHQNRPIVSSADEFMASLSAKMHAMSEIKSLHEKQLRHSRNQALLFLCIGVSAGVALTVFILTTAIPFLVALDIKLLDVNVLSLIKTALLIVIPLSALVLGLIPWKNKHQNIF